MPRSQNGTLDESVKAYLFTWESVQNMLSGKNVPRCYVLADHVLSTSQSQTRLCVMEGVCVFLRFNLLEVWNPSYLSYCVPGA